MATSRAVSFTYSIVPPEGVDPSTALHHSRPVPSSGSRTIPFPSPPTASTSVSSPSTQQPSNTNTYYASASSALRDAQKGLNEVLTAWKDAVGDREKYKEDSGAVGHGQGKVARMMAASKIAEAQVGVGQAVGTGSGGKGAEEEEEEEDEDGVELAEVYWQTQ